MKYNLSINQLQMKQAGLSLNQWLILDVLSVSPTWARALSVEGEIYFWVSRQAISRELEVLDLKPDTVYRHLKKLSELGYIDYVKSGKKDCIRLSNKGKNLFTSTMSEMKHDYYVGNETQNTMSEAVPTYHNTSYHNTGGKPTEEQVKDIGKKLNIPEEVCMSFYLYYESKGWKGILDFVPLLRKWNMSEKPKRKKPNFTPASELVIIP